MDRRAGREDGGSVPRFGSVAGRPTSGPPADHADFPRPRHRAAATAWSIVGDSPSRHPATEQRSVLHPRTMAAMVAGHAFRLALVIACLLLALVLPTAGAAQTALTESTIADHGDGFDLSLSYPQIGVDS